MAVVDDGRVRADLLGVPSLSGPAGQVLVTRPQVQLVLALLLWEAKPTTSDALAEALWGDRPLGAHWKGAVRGVLSKVRDGFDTAGIPVDLSTRADGFVRLVLPEGFRVDVLDAEEALEAAEAAMRSGSGRPDPELAGRWSEALQQPFLPACDGQWVRWAHGRVHDLGRRFLVVHARSLIASGRPGDAEAPLRRWVADHPLDEPAHHLLIESLVAAGRRTDAHVAYDELREVLHEELGVGPAASASSLLGAAASASPSPPPSPTPPPVAARPTDGAVPAPLLGRAPETAAIEEVWQAVASRGLPGLVLLRGPSGIGKTRLATEFQAQASAAGARTLVGRCSPGASLPFEPLMSMLDGALDRTAEGSNAAPDDPATVRAQVFQRATESMALVVDRPTVLVVDDVQWIDADGLALLEHLLATTSAPLLVVVTGRELPDRVHDTMARLIRQSIVQTLSLRGLSVEDLLPLFDDEDGSGTSASERAAALHRRTGGIPFFISEITRSAGQLEVPIDGDVVPDAVREWIGHRVDALPRQLRSRLDLAAVLGPRVRVTDLAACAQATVDSVIDDVEALIELGFLAEESEVGTVSLPHLITQEIVYGRLGALRAARLHLAAAEGLGLDPAVNPAVVAGHLERAGSEHRDAAARRYSEAADGAYRRGAWSVALQWQRAALALSSDLPDRRATALVGIGRALHIQGQRDEAEAHLDEAIEVARANDLAMDLAEAAIALVGRAGRGATRRPDADQIALLEEALGALERSAAAEPNADDPAVHRRRAAIWCRVEVELALALSLWAPLERRTALADSGLRRAQELDPPDVDLTAQCLLSSHTVRATPAQARDRLEAGAEVLALPMSSRSIDTTLTALTYRYEDLLRFGQQAEARTYLDAAIELAERYDHPYWGWATATWLGLDAIVRGDLQAAEELATEAAARPNSDEGGALACFGVNLVNIRLYQGRSHEVLDLLSGAVAQHPEIPCYQAVLALCAAAADERDLALGAFDPFLRSEFATIPHDSNRLLSLGVLADAAVRLDAVEAAPMLGALLEPYREQHLLLNCYGGGGAYWGTVSSALARLASLRAGAPVSSA